MDNGTNRAAAKKAWGDTAAYREFEKKTAGLSDADLSDAGEGLMKLLAAFGTLGEKNASAPEAQTLVKRLQDYITAHFYTCTDEILAGLGRLYTEDEAFTASIDRAGGQGTAAKAAEAIAAYCAGKNTGFRP